MGKQTDRQVPDTELRHTALQQIQPVVVLKAIRSRILSLDVFGGIASASDQSQFPFHDLRAHSV